MNIKPLPSAEYLHTCLTLLAATLYWRERPREHFNSDMSFGMWNAKFAGRVAGRKMPGLRYWQVMIDGKRYLNHRVIAAMSGIDTSGLIDHRDRDGSNNHPANLRASSVAQNTRNNSGWKKKASRTGTSQKKNGKWVAYIRVSGKNVHLGTFAAEADACKARASAERIHYGEFAPRVKFNDAEAEATA